MNETFGRVRAAIERQVRRAAPWIIVVDGLLVLGLGWLAVQSGVHPSWSARLDLDPSPYSIFEGPMIVAGMLLVLLIFEPMLRGTSSTALATLEPAQSIVPQPFPPSAIGRVVDHRPPLPVRRLLPASTERRRWDRRIVSFAAAGAATAGMLGVLGAVLARMRRRR